MNSYANQLQENKNLKTAAVTQRKSHHKVSNYPANVAQMQLQEIANNSLQVKQALQLRAIANSALPIQKKGVEEEELQMKAAPIQRKGIEEEEAVQGKFALPIQKKANNTGLPDNLKSGIENLSGFAMDDVKVHYNSAKPAQLQAHAYAQGTDIHLGSGQEKHLPHEAWHVVQQKQGRVQPTMQMKGNVNVNDDAGLENEADVMGEKALQTKSKNSNTIIDSSSSTNIVQRAWVGRRALAQKEFLKWNVQKDHDDNQGVFHEHIFFEDHKEPENQGFGPSGIFTEGVNGYTKIHGGYNDYHMRLAAASNSIPGEYKILSNNCQNWVEKVLNSYHKLRQEEGSKKVQDQTDGEEMREISNSSIKLDLNTLSPGGEYEMQ